MSPENFAFPEQPPEKELYPHQLAVLDSIQRARENGESGGYINVATGLGKTLTAAHDVKRFLAEHPDERVLYLCHRAPILKQASQTFTEVIGTTDHGQMFGGEYKDQEQIVFATLQTMGRRLGGGHVYEAFDSREFGYVVVDESHHGPAPTYRQVIDHFQPKFKLGLTATPERRDEQDIGDIFGPEMARITLEEAIAKGYLVRPDYHVLTDNVRRFSNKELAHMSLGRINKLMFVPKRDEEIAATIRQHLERIEDPRMIVFCPSIAHTEYFADLLPGTTEVLHSKLSQAEKDARLEAFRSGEVGTLLAVDMLNEGVDVPEVNAVVFLRSTESKTVFFQQLGRGLRKIPGKESVLVLDFAASWERLSTLRALEKGIRGHRQGTHRAPQPLTIETDINFDFSEEALHAVETIRRARAEKQHPRVAPKPTRTEKWAVDEAEVKAMLSIERLPKQRVTAAEWRQYGEWLELTHGDASVIEELLRRNIRHLYLTAKTFSQSADTVELTLEEHFQHAVEGFYNGIIRFMADPANRDLRTDIGFGIYSILSKRAQDAGLIRQPYNFQNMESRLQSKRTELAKQIGEQAVDALSIGELARALGIRTGDLIAHLAMWGRSSYNNLQGLEHAAHVPSDEVSHFDQAEDSIRRTGLREALENLAFRERRVLELHYGLYTDDPKTLREVGRTFNVTPERIRQIAGEALKKLRDLGESDELRSEVWIPEHLTTEQQARRNIQIAKELLQSRIIRLADHLNLEASVEIDEEEQPSVRAMAASLDGMMRGKLAYSLRSWPGSIIAKNTLARQLAGYIGSNETKFGLLHGDFVKALIALERHGRVELGRNERGTVIENITLLTIPS